MFKKMFKLEFSKILAIIISVLFTTIVGIVTLVWTFTNKTPEQLQVGIDIIGTVATPFGIVITGYFAKAGTENYQKIKGGLNNDNE